MHDPDHRPARRPGPDDTEPDPRRTVARTVPAAHAQGPALERIRREQVRGLAIAGEYERDFTSTFITRKLDLQKMAQDRGETLPDLESGPEPEGR